MSLPYVAKALRVWRGDDDGERSNGTIKNCVPIADEIVSPPARNPKQSTKTLAVAGEGWDLDLGWAALGLGRNLQRGGSIGAN